MITLKNLRCEYLENPLGLDVENPRLFWQLAGSGKNIRQRAYQILVASSPEALSKDTGDLWDSGRVASDQNIHVRYSGAPLAPLTRAHWKVRVWTLSDESGNVEVESDWSEPAWWESGVDRWSADWIADIPMGGPRTSSPSPHLRREFHASGTVIAARLVATALGLYVPRLNGRRIGSDHLTPGWTDYKHRVRYQVYDVTDLIQEGQNCLGAILGDGWYSGHVEWRGRQFYGDRPKFLAQLHIRYADGTEEVIGTDSEWRAQFGSIISNDLIMGEHVDARRDLGQWDLPGYDDSEWRPVMVVDHPEGMAIVGQDSPTVKVTEEIRPISIHTIPAWPKNQYVLDFGQNMVGYVRLRVSGKAGDTVRIRHGERLDPKGKLYTENLRTALQTDFFTLIGNPEGEVFEPLFTFHGFQYVELMGLDSPPALDDVTGVVIHSDNDRSGEFECNDPLINQLVRNIDWGWRGNSVDVPTDCPQRDERLGWTGDAQVFVQTASYFRNVAAFFGKYIQDLEDSQSPNGSIPPVAPMSSSLDGLNGDGGPAWADAFLICPWTIYQNYGDRELLLRHYSAYQRFVQSLEDAAIDGVRSHPKKEGFHGFGDWLNTNAETPNDLIGTAFFAHSAKLLAKIANVLGKFDDAQRYAELFTKVRSTFQNRFLTPDGLLVAQTQTAYILALHFELLPEELRQRALDALVADIEKRGGHLSTGFVGTPYIARVLSDGGRADVAYRLLHQEAWPSWLYSVTQGATTIWERWDGWTHDKGFQDVGMNSFNHYAYGAIGAWLFGVVAGIEFDENEPGYKHIHIRPIPGGKLTHAKASLGTLHGRVASEWRQTNDRLELTVTIPPNCTGSIRLPANERQTVSCSEPGLTVDSAGAYQVGSGTHRFFVSDSVETAEGVRA